MDLYLTYCSADKDPAPGELPAMQRYRSQRILAVYDASLLSGAEFRILSGRFGLVAAADALPDYDHLLVAEEVETVATRVAEQLVGLVPDTVFFFHRSRTDDPAAQPYRDCLDLACMKAGQRHYLIEIPPDIPAAMQLLSLVAHCRVDQPPR